MPIKIKSLENISRDYQVKQYVYKDITLDLAQVAIKSPGIANTIPGSDLQESLDIAAIRNSLANLFGTIQGQRVLFPTYGVDLHRYLFSQITEQNGRAIGNAILRGIKKFEPRVEVERVSVNTDAENNQYTFNVEINLLVLNITTSFDFVLDVKTQSVYSIPANTH